MKESARTVAAVVREGTGPARGDEVTATTEKQSVKSKRGKNPGDKEMRWRDCKYTR